MAGGSHQPFKVDPAIERWSEMHATMYKRFRLTPRNARACLIFGAIIPYAAYQLSLYTDDRWALRAKGRGESLLRVPPPAPAGEEE